MCTSLGLCAGVLVCAATAAADITEIIIGRDSTNKLHVHFEGDMPVDLNVSVFPGYPGWAEGEPGFESTTLDEPEEDFFIPDAAADLVWILVSLGPGISVLNDTGTGPMSPGQSFTLGNPFFDVHPFWSITAGPPTLQTFVRFYVHDRSGLYADSDIIELPFTPACYANCDNSETSPILNANDFQCFLNKFAANDAYANCDGSSIAPILNANDFQCFLNKFAAGCE